MKRTAFDYRAYVLLEFTREEAELLRECARAHYDGACQLAAEPGPRGIINGMVNSAEFRDGVGEAHLNGRDLDLLRKVVEPTLPLDGPKAAMFQTIREALWQAWQDLVNESQWLIEQDVLRNGAKPPAVPVAPHPHATRRSS